MLKYITYLLFICLVGQYVTAQNDYQFGKINVRNFGTNEYHGVAQNWSAIQNNDNFILIANNSGVLHFDGTSWLKVKLFNEESVKSLAKNDSGVVFVGGDGEFGKLKYDNFGRLQYEKLSQDSLYGDVIWNTITYGNQVNFVSKDNIYTLNSTNEIKTTSTKIFGPVVKSVKYNDKIICFHNLADTLAYCSVFNGTGFTKIKNSNNFEPKISFISNNITYVIDKNGKFKELLKTGDNYKFIDLGISLESSEKLKITTIAICDNLIAAGTSNGIYLFSKNGKFIKSIKEDDGLINLQIRYLYFDHNNNLWSCNDNGISLIDISSPVRTFDNDNGITFTTEDFYFSETENYLGTRSDLFSKEIIDNKIIFKNANIFNMEVFQIKNFTFSDGKNKTLFIANDGIYEIRNNKKYNINDLYAWDLSQSKANPDRIWVGLDGDGIGSLLYKNGEITIESAGFKKTNGEVRKVIEHNNNVYYAVKNKGIHLLDTTKEQSSNTLLGLVPFETKKDEIEYQQFTIEVFKNKIYVGTDNGLYTIENNILTPFSNEFIKRDLKVHRLYNDHDEKLWLVLVRNNDQSDEQPEIGYIEFSDSTNTYISSPFRSVSKEVIQAIDIDNDGIVWFAGLKEIYAYNPNSKSNYTDPYKVFITNVTAGDTIIAQYTHKIDKISSKIGYESNTVTIGFSTPSYLGGIKNDYSFYLDGIDSKWSEWDNDPEATFQRLQEGNYTFHVKARNYYGIESQEAAYKFTILPPWYRTWWAYIIYVIATIIIIYVIIKLSIRRVKEQNEKLEKIVEERTAKVEQQKHEIEEKNQDIVDSIKYAKRIQNTILPTTENLNSILSDYFIIYKPKDIVSGDFYWADDLDGKSYFSAIDCTGHGVPGAFVSIVGFNGLKRTVNEFKHRQPGLILDKLTDLVVETFSSSDTHLKDGMDMSLCALDYKTLKLEYAGANNPLILIRNGELIEVKGNKQPIGDFEKRVPFTNHEIQLEKGDNIYLFTDGYADQFGGPKGKKFKLKTLKNLLLELSNLPIDEQKKKLEIAFNDWKGAIEQLDDVCLIGVKI